MIQGPVHSTRVRGAPDLFSMFFSDASSNLTKSVSYGLELANQVLDKEIEIEIDVDRVTEQVSNLATKTVTQSKVRFGSQLRVVQTHAIFLLKTMSERDGYDIIYVTYNDFQFERHHLQSMFPIFSNVKRIKWFLSKMYSI